MISLLFGVGYGEVVWWLIKEEKNTLSSAKSWGWGMIIFNFMVAMVEGSLVNLEISIIILIYVLVIFNLRSNDGKSKT